MHKYNIIDNQPANMADESTASVFNEIDQVALEKYSKVFTDVINPQYCYESKVVSVYDGDTITCNIRVYFFSGQNLGFSKIVF